MDREQLMGHGHIVERGLREALRSEPGELLAQGPVSYTHLTLPTILLV